MSGGSFLLGLRDVTSGERIIKIKSLLEEDLDIDHVKFWNANDDKTTSKLLSHTGILSCSPKHLSLSDDSRRVAVHIADYLASKKVKKRFGDCRKEDFSGNLVPENSDFSYL